MTLEIGGILLVPIIVALVEGAKAFLGLPPKYAPLLNAVLSVLGVLLVQYTSGSPETQPTVVLALQMAVLFLTNAGLYREGIEKMIRGKR